MIEDFRTSSPADGCFETDICIVGAGAAGITLARQFDGSGHRVLLLESGGRDFETSVQSLNEGACSGLPYYDLDAARLRLFGGTLNIWGGRVAELDPIDFESRPWIPHSGWPFGKSALAPYYTAARAVLGLPDIADNALPGYQPPFDTDELRTSFWQFDKKADRFALSACADLVRSTDVTCLLHATVTELTGSENGERITQARVAAEGGKQAQIRARVFILTNGALEATRLLLASRPASHPDGIGNGAGLVGRFFMEHPHGRAAEITTQDAKTLFAALPRFVRQSGHRFGLLLRSGEALQKREGILNSGFTLALRRPAGARQEGYKQVYNGLRHDLNPTRTSRWLWQRTRKISVWVQDKVAPHLAARALRRGKRIYAVLRAEQAPNPESRLRLSDKRDALGMPRLDLDWRLSDLDKRSALTMIGGLDRELRRTGLGSAEPSPWLADPSADWEFDPLASNHPIGGYHHMGTTRMAESSAHGVTDGQGRVHGVANLYIASTSLFPTAGWANPTLTLIALTLRLADYLRDRSTALGNGRAN